MIGFHSTVLCSISKILETKNTLKGKIHLKSLSYLILFLEILESPKVASPLLVESEHRSWICGDFLLKPAEMDKQELSDRH